ncbi:hypothetical protein [Hoeflea halophila]|uniref:hypothetical protein n=1 Tax=Hoeflea halophila TaxID=714899 RepID=UPI000BE2777C|nr:hypothetical protein [Hoeflea halophila]
MQADTPACDRIASCAIVTGCAQAGLRVSELTGFPRSNREVDYEVYVGNQAPLPLCYTLIATKA